MCAKNKYSHLAKHVGNTGFKIIHVYQKKIQHNDDDCGVFTLLFAKHFIEMHSKHGYPNIISPKCLKLFKSKTTLSDAEMIRIRQSFFASYFRLYSLPIFIRERFYKEYNPFLHKIGTGFLTDYEIYDLFHNNIYTTFERLEKCNEPDSNISIPVTEDIYDKLFLEDKLDNKSESSPINVKENKDDESKSTPKDLDDKKKSKDDVSEKGLKDIDEKKVPKLPIDDSLKEEKNVDDSKKDESKRENINSETKKVRDEEKDKKIVALCRKKDQMKTRTKLRQNNLFKKRK